MRAGVSLQLPFVGQCLETSLRPARWGGARDEPTRCFPMWSTETGEHALRCAYANRRRAFRHAKDRIANWDDLSTPAGPPYGASRAELPLVVLKINPVRVFPRKPKINPVTVSPLKINLVRSRRVTVSPTCRHRLVTSGAWSRPDIVAATSQALVGRGRGPFLPIGM
jgi:hypothetical protein